MATKWTQIGGDVDPKDHGAVLARRDVSSLGLQIELVEIDPNDEGRGYHVSRADVPVSDLGWEANKDVGSSHGHSKRDWDSMEFEHRAMDRLRHWGAGHLGGDTDLVRTWSEALPARSNQIKWWR